MFRKIGSALTAWPGEIFYSFKNLIRNPRKTPLEDISRILISAMKLFSIILAIVLLILFIVDGGYALQVRQIGGPPDIYTGASHIVEGQGFFTRVGAAFTTGRAAEYFSDFAVITFIVLLGCSLITVFLAYILQEVGHKKVVIIILFSLVSLLLFVVPLLIFLIFNGTLEMPMILAKFLASDIPQDTLATAISSGAQNDLFAYFLASHYLTALFILLGYAGLLVISSIVMSKCQPDIELVGKWWLALFLSLAILPLGLLILKNIIPLVVGGGAVALIIAAIIFVFKLFSGSSSTKVIKTFDKDTGKEYKIIENENDGVVRRYVADDKD